jgi:hypothetical protein
MDGGCTCGAIRYRMESPPLMVHCCHCSWCQRESGSAFAVNALIESARLTILEGAPELVLTPSASGKGQKIVRCPVCRVAVWSHYPQAGDAVSFVRVGTLDNPGACPPDVHIYVSAKQPWVVLPEGARAFPEFYDPRAVWREESRERVRAARKAASG